VPRRASFRSRVESRAVPRILLAEGHAPTREFVARALADAGVEVVQADDSAAAWERYAAQRPDAVVLAADLEGEAAPSALVERVRGADPRAVLIVADREHLARARGLPALLGLKVNAYVADPTSRELVERVRELLLRSPARLRGIALVLSRPPSARGEVKPGVVARLLHQIWRSLSEGVLVIEEGGVERRLLFLRGVPVACQSDDPADGLARWLLDGGRMDAAAHEAALEAMASGLSQGAALIAAGVLEHGEPLHAALRAHLEGFAQRLVGTKEGRWRFHAGGEVASEVQPVELLPLGVILAGARAHVPLRHFSDALRAVTDAYPVRTGDFQQVLPAAGLGSADLRLALAVDGRMRTREYLGARKADLKEALSLLWFLSMVGAVAFHETPEAAGAEYGAAPPRKKRPLPADRAEAVRQAALLILPGTYLHALGLDLAATDDDVERAYREVASRFHPDGFAEYDVGELEDLLAAVQDGAFFGKPVISGNNLTYNLDSYCYSNLALCTSKEDGTGTIQQTSLLNLFPNPNSGTFTIQYIGETGNAINISVLNMLGQTLYERKVMEFFGEMEATFFRSVTSGVVAMSAGEPDLAAQLSPGDHTTGKGYAADNSAGNNG
jgi:DNA-binding response OmpR family regulator